jgi:hypothetical protein
MVTAVGKMIRTKNGFHWGDALRIPINTNHLSCITQQQVSAGGKNGRGQQRRGPEKQGMARRRMKKACFI